MRGITLSFFIVLLLGSHVSADSVHSLSYMNMDGNIVSYDKFEGKPLLVDTFATWCEPCKTEVLNLMNMYDSLSEQLTVFTIDVSPSTDDINDIISYRNDFGAQWEFGLDNSGSFSGTYATAVIPTLYLFDKNGEFLEQWVGVTDPDELLLDLERILNVDFAEVDSNFLSQVSNQLLENGLLKLTGSFMLISLVYILIVPAKEEVIPID